MTRTRYLTFMTLLLGSLMALGPASAQISGDVVRIGVINDMSGLYSDLGGEGSVEAARIIAARSSMPRIVLLLLRARRIARKGLMPSLRSGCRDIQGADRASCGWRRDLQKLPCRPAPSAKRRAPAWVSDRNASCPYRTSTRIAS